MIDLNYFPLLAAFVILLAGVALLKGRSRRGLLFGGGYLIIGCVSYLYWIYEEAGPPHGEPIIAHETMGDLAWSFIVAVMAILAWPFWPVLRVFVTSSH